MDFKNLCQNIDVSSLKARIPSMPAMPQIKLPKSLPKLRSHRIFSRSRDDVSRIKGSSSIKEQQQQQQQQLQPNSFQHLSTQSIIPPADFINHTPHRISTISSLMSQDERGGVVRGSGDSQRGTYRSAHSVDDDYPSPYQYQAGGRLARHMSPINDVASINGGGGGGAPAETTVVKMTFSEKLQKGCKDISEFRLSHIFAKKTVVRKDTIQVDHYVERFKEDRKLELAEEERRERNIADNYRFDFKLSRQDTDNSKRSVSSMESPQQQQHTRMPEQSEDESGMEATPPPRKPGIASTRFARVRKPPLEQYLTDEESNNELDEDADKVQQALQNSPPHTVRSSNAPESRTSKALSKLRSMSKRSEETSDKAGEKKRRAPLTPQQSEEQGVEPATSNPDDSRFGTLKQNIKRFSKSMRRGGTQEADKPDHRTADEETEGEEAPCTPKQDKSKPTTASRTERFTARLRKFASHDSSTVEQVDDETATPKKSDEQRSPIRAAISNKLQTWKKSFKRNRTEDDDGRQTGEETSPEHAKDKPRPDGLMKKLNNMRQRKRASSTEEHTAADEGTEDETNNKTAATKRTVNFEERFEQARKRTLKKMNEKMTQMKFFSKSQEQLDKAAAAVSTKKSAIEDDGDEQSADERTVYVRSTARTAARRAAACDTPTDSEEEDEAASPQKALGGAYAVKDIANTQLAYDTKLSTRTLWTTKNLLTESFDSETDSEFPRVLIHQDNSDQYESTLIIAVTRPAPSPPPTTAIIEEIHDDEETKPKQKPPRPSRTPSPGSGRAEWIPNNESISNFLDLTPPSKRRLSAEAILPPRGHMRQMSLDSNSDSDSWIPENVRRKSLSQQRKEGALADANGMKLNTNGANEQPWKVQQANGEEKLYKAKSIDIFEASVHQAAFDDFEEELRNEPVLRVPQQRHVDSSFEKDSSEEPFAKDDDNSSRVTRISVSVIREECEEMLESAESTELIKMPQLGERVFGNSSESLIAHSKDTDNDGYEDDDDDDDEDEDDEVENENDRPPSAPPSPPPRISPPLPPLPPRKPPLAPAKSIESSSSPPTTKPPLMPPTTKPTTTAPPPRIPERTPSMSRIAKPLVKTSSLRLAYDEQVHPSDVGKVNKLISRFESTQTTAPPTLRQRPRIIRRRLTRDESEEYSDDEDDLDEESNSEHEPMDTERDVTPTPTNTPRTYSLESDTESIRQVVNTTQLQRIGTTNQRQTSLKLEDANANPNLGNGTQAKLAGEMPKITLNFDTNSNLSLSCASSEYGSPLEYPSSLIGSTETTPIPERKAPEPLVAKNGERNRRSMTRDDDKFLSFDSDDENSYYSISSTSSSRYVVEI